MPIHERLRTIPQVVELMPGVTEYSLREWVRHAKTNGFRRVICRPQGNRIYIDLLRLDEWLEELLGAEVDDTDDD